MGLLSSGFFKNRLSLKRNGPFLRKPAHEPALRRRDLCNLFGFSTVKSITFGSGGTRLNPAAVRALDEREGERSPGYGGFGSRACGGAGVPRCRSPSSPSPPNGMLAESPHPGDSCDRVVPLQCETGPRGVLDRLSAKGVCRHGTSGGLGICNRGNPSPCCNKFSAFILKARRDSSRRLARRGWIPLCVASWVLDARETGERETRCNTHTTKTRGRRPAPPPWPQKQERGAVGHPQFHPPWVGGAGGKLIQKPWF
jgi:hypothetical protein